MPSTEEREWRRPAASGTRLTPSQSNLARTGAAFGPVHEESWVITIPGGTQPSIYQS
jgi:hypothetical protein